MRRSRIGAADRLAFGLLVAIPVVMGVPPSLFGRPLLAGDNLTQNYPLRVLAGALLRQGHLPLWDAWMWSGTPLLAGWNAGAMYPGTWLFAVMGGVSAWTVNYVAVGVVVATGTYVFLRQERIGPLAAFLGAAVFSFAGFMAAQMLHIGLVAGLSFLPWMLVALNGMARRERGLGAGWVLLLGACGGLVLLAGDPRAISNAAEIVVAYAVALAWRDRRRALPLLGGLALGALLALGLGAVQWLPGVQFIASSQRGQTSYAFYGNLSLAPGNLPLVLFPYLLGGYGDLGTHGYSGPYNLPELTWSLGILPLVAAFALASRRLRSPGGRPLGVWYAIVAVGLVTALGSSTPLGHLFARIPGFGAERLQARNIMLADFGMAVLFAVWVDEVLAPDRLSPDPVLGPAARRRGLVPVVAAVLLVAVGEVFEARTASALGVAASRSAGVIRTMTPYLAPATVIVVLAGALVLGMHHLEPRRRRLLLTLLAVTDLAFFVVNESIVPIDPSYIAPANALSAQVAALAGPHGRYAVYNPIQVNSDPGNVSVYQLGLSDLSIVHRVLEVGGYGSAVDAAYQQATASHWVETLRTSSLRSDVFDDLDLRVLLTLPVYVANPLSPGAGPPTPLPGPPQAGVPTDTPGSPGLAPNVGQLPVPAGGRLTYQLPGPLDVRSVSVTLTNAGTGGGGTGGRADPPGGAGGRVRVGLVAAAGPTTWVGTVPEPSGLDPSGADPASASTVAAGAAGRDSLQVVLAAPAGAPAVAETVVVTTTSGERLLLDGALEGSLQPPHWRYGGMVGPWLVYLDTRTRGLSWVVPLGSTYPGVASVPGSSATTDVQWPQGPDTTTVTTPVAALVVRSVAAAAGWQAELLRPAGRTTVPVQRLGPVQAVRVPAGTTTIVWTYTSGTAVDAAWISAATALLLVCAGLAVIFARRRSAGESEPAPARNGFASIS